MVSTGEGIWWPVGAGNSQSEKMDLGPIITKNLNFVNNLNKFVIIYHCSIRILIHGLADIWGRGGDTKQKNRSQEYVAFSTVDVNLNANIYHYIVG
jgi:hypothetical protein